MTTLVANTRNSDSHRHVKKYILPFVNSEYSTHTLAKSHFGLVLESKIRISGVEVIDDRYHAIVFVENERYQIPVSKINKPVVARNAGLAFEKEVVEHLNSNGLMSGNGAGCTGGNDFHLIDRYSDRVYQGEAKRDLRAAFGQVSLNYDNEWKISAKAKSRYPTYTSTVESATINGNDFIQTINICYGKLDRDKPREKTNLYSDPIDLTPVNAYLSDHSVDVLHVGSHGTFDASSNSLGYTIPNGTGRFRVRNKHLGSLTVQFNVLSLNKSEKDLTTHEETSRLKTILGAI